MIQEISNFVDTIPQEYHTEGLKPTPGLHILIDLDKNGKLKENGYKSFLVKKKNEEIDYDFDFGTRSHYSRLVDLNKPIDNKKKIHSYVPYVLLFKNLSTDDKNEIKKKDWDAFEENERFDKITKPYLVDVIKDRIKPFYDYFINHKEITDDEKELTKRIKEFANKKILNLILFDSKTKQMDYNNYFVVYFNVAFELVKKWNAVYKKDKVFNKIDFNTDDNEFGLSNFLNGANIKKILCCTKQQIMRLIIEFTSQLELI